jgi:hypothetical protein
MTITATTMISTAAKTTTTNSKLPEDIYNCKNVSNNCNIEDN